MNKYEQSLKKIPEVAFHDFTVKKMHRAWHT